MIGYKRFEDDTSRIETRLVFAKNQDEEEQQGKPRTRRSFGEMIQLILVKMDMNHLTVV